MGPGFRGLDLFRDLGAVVSSMREAFFGPAFFFFFPQPPPPELPGAGALTPPGSRNPRLFGAVTAEPGRFPRETFPFFQFLPFFSPFSPIRLLMKYDLVLLSRAETPHPLGYLIWWYAIFFHGRFPRPQA